MEEARHLERDQPAAPPRVSTTLAMSLAAVAAALIAIFGEKGSFSALTVAFALVGLVPWALDAGGIRLHPLLFIALVIAPAAVIVLGDRNPGGMFPVMLGVVWLTRATAKPWLVGLTIGSAVATTIGLAVLEGTTHETGAIYFLGGVGVSWLAGAMIRRQEQLVGELRHAHARDADHAAAAERTRIAREVHDVVAHSLTVTMLHVAGARRALVHDPQRAAEALERAEAVGRDSLDSIRRIVGLLRSGDDASDATLPELADIPALVDQYRSAGLTVDADLQVDGVTADSPTSLTAFRVVQESLANALQHAPGMPVHVRVAGASAGTVLRIVVENPMPTVQRHSDRGGLGVRGMTERVRAAGGSLEAGVTDDRTWRVEAALPLHAAAVAR